LGQIGRQLYHLALEKDDIEIVAVADIGKPKSSSICSKRRHGERPALQDNYLDHDKFRTRMLQLARPEESVGCYERRLPSMRLVDIGAGGYGRHLRAGAKRVILASLLSEPIDRIGIPGIEATPRRK
jgi:hypothetical protein